MAAATLAAVALAAVPASAHRRDEYLQAARVAIEPGRVEIELDLTPGIAVADAVLADVDVDRNAVISTGEAQRYTARVMDAIRLDVDGTPLPLSLSERSFPAVEAMRNGEGTIRLRMAAAMPALASGTHHLHYRNGHRPEIAAYLANALLPASASVTITDQQRDADQRTLDVAYVLDGDAGPGLTRSPAIAGAGLMTSLALFWFARAGAQRARQRKISR